MKRTLLELTQDILVSLDGDEVSAITDTAESTQVASIIRQCFYEIASNWKLPEHHTFFELTETSASSPTIMTKPTDVISISWVKYDTGLVDDGDIVYKEINFLPKNTFFTQMDSLNELEDDISTFNYTIGSDIFPFKYYNDRFPSVYTTYDDSTLVFDAIDENETTYLRKTKTWCYGLKESSWTHTGSAVPNLDHKLSNLLFQKAKTQCFAELKQVENPLALKKERRAELTMIKEKNDINADGVWYYHDSRQLPNYGRK